VPLSGLPDGGLIGREYIRREFQYTIFKGHG
jgi:hypothetical protein